MQQRFRMEVCWDETSPIFGRHMQACYKELEKSKPTVECLKRVADGCHHRCCRPRVTCVWSSQRSRMDFLALVLPTGRPRPGNGLELESCLPSASSNHNALHSTFQRRVVTSVTSPEFIWNKSFRFSCCSFNSLLCSKFNLSVLHTTETFLKEIDNSMDKMFVNFEIKSF